MNWTEQLSRSAPVVLLGIDPIGGPVARRVLAGHNRDACRRADVVRVEVAEPGAYRGEPLHVRRAISVVEWMAFRLAVFIGQHGNRGVHHPHVVNEKEDNVRLVLSLSKRRVCKTVQR